jgi:hypothetical protein
MEKRRDRSKAKKSPTIAPTRLRAFTSADCRIFSAPSGRLALPEP